MSYGLTDDTIDKIKSVLAAYPEVEQAILYGSRAKGTFKRASDIDLTLKGAQLTLTHQFRIENQLDDLLLPYTIDLSLWKHIKSPDLLDHIDRVGIVLFRAGELV